MKFQAVAEKTAKDARGLLYFAAPGIYIYLCYFNKSRLLTICIAELPTSARYKVRHKSQTNSAAESLFNCLQCRLSYLETAVVFSYGYKLFSGKKETRNYKRRDDARTRKSRNLTHAHLKFMNIILNPVVFFQVIN